MASLVWPFQEYAKWLGVDALAPQTGPLAQEETMLGSIAGVDHSEDTTRLSASSQS